MSSNFNYLLEEVQKGLKCIAETLVSPEKGILSVDESSNTMEKRLQEVGIKNNEQNRLLWRRV